MHRGVLFPSLSCTEVHCSLYSHAKRYTVPIIVMHRGILFPSCENQRLAVKPCYKECLKWRDSRKYIFHDNMRKSNGKYCKVGKLIKFFKGYRNF